MRWYVPMVGPKYYSIKLAKASVQIAKTEPILFTAAATTTKDVVLNLFMMSHNVLFYI